MMSDFTKEELELLVKAIDFVIDDPEGEQVQPYFDLQMRIREEIDKRV
jgi:hypothetical protein